MGQLVVSLGRQHLLLGFILGKATAQSSEVSSSGTTCLEQLNMTADLVSCPSTAEVRFWSCLDSLVRLPGLAGLHIKLRSKWCNELVSMSSWGSRTVLTAGMASCFGTQKRQIYVLSCLARWANWLFSEDRVTDLAFCSRACVNVSVGCAI